MPKLDEEKAKLDELRVYRNFALTSLLALIGFVFTKMNKLDIWILILSGCAVIMLGVFVVILQKRILKLIKKIGEL